MTDAPDTIELDSIEQLGTRRVADHINYIVAGPDVYRLTTDDFAGEYYLERVEEIPDEHWERYDDE